MEQVSDADPLAGWFHRSWHALPDRIAGLTREKFAFIMLWALAASFAIAGGLGVLVFGFGSDSHAYYQAWDGPMYDELPGELDAYLYSPAFAQAIWPLTRLPWPLFSAVISACAAAALTWLLSPVPLRYRLPLLTLCVPEILTGNIFWALALVAVWGLRLPALWVLPALTKILPTLGPVWFLARREWRNLAITTTCIVAASGISYVSAPDLWQQWIRFLLSSAQEDDLANSPIAPPLWIRAPAAICLTIYAARRDRPGWLPVAMLLSTPMLGHGAYALLAAVPRLAQGVVHGPRHPRHEQGGADEHVVVDEADLGHRHRDQKT